MRGEAVKRGFDTVAIERQICVCSPRSSTGQGDSPPLRGANVISCKADMLMSFSCRLGLYFLKVGSIYGVGCSSRHSRRLWIVGAAVRLRWGWAWPGLDHRTHFGSRQGEGTCPQMLRELCRASVTLKGFIITWGLGVLATIITKAGGASASHCGSGLGVRKLWDP